MKKNNIITIFTSLLICSCSYLDVVPPEQPDLDDILTDNESVLDMVYSCYGYIEGRGLNPNCYTMLTGGGTDECVAPQEWGNLGSKAQWGAITPSSINDTYNYPWRPCYSAIGYCNLFLKLLDEYNPTVTPSDRQMYIAEVKFLKAYYHYRLLAMYGPIPIMDTHTDPNIPKDKIPGRSHFDYCVEYIVRLLDEAAEVLPNEHAPEYYGRATSVICKALKARVLVLAASPLWNGQFFDKTWKNSKYETPGYGMELVSREYDHQKWVRAKEACEEAITIAEQSGAALFNIEASEILRTNQKLALPQVPGLDASTPEGEEFRKRVMMLRFMMTTSPQDGNKEQIWAIAGGSGSSSMGYNFMMASVPHYAVYTQIGSVWQNYGAWGGLSPTLYTVQNFFTANGVIPAEDPSFPAESNWYKSAGLPEDDIINLNVGREPRFYAWISFDGDEFSPVVNAGKPLICDMKNPEEGGYNAAKWGTRNYCVTGFLNKKWIHPNFRYTGSEKNNNFNSCSYPMALIRLPELYLNLAECYAQLGEDGNALTYLNKIRERAGVPQWTTGNLGEKSLLEAVLQERFVELYMEGLRYYDIRRYLNGRDRLSKECYLGLNAIQEGPTFTEFNTVVPIAQQFSWHNRQYLMPVPNDEVYSNPQMVQAPGY